MRAERIQRGETIYADRYQRLYRVTADFGTFQKHYCVNDTGVRAGLVAVRDDAVLLVRQYRLLLDDLSWEIPGGRVDEGETPAEAALRECREETGVICRQPQPLIFYQAGLDISHCPTHVFYATPERLGTPVCDRREVVACEWVPLARCREMIARRQLVDGLTIMGLLAYQQLCPPS
jgi:8-oxo-dGTP pyrophosphatase MutT (NUDIX family)